MRLRWILLGLLLVLVAAAIWFRMLKATPVETARVTRGTAVEVVYATGFVEVEEPVEIAARVTAPVAEVRVREGARVASGEVLAVLDAADLAAQIAQLAAQTRGAEAEAARTLALVARGFASKAAGDRVIANRDAARAAERAARDRLGNFVLSAGVSGVVLRRDAEVGDLATPTKVLFVLGEPTDIKVTATIDERDIPRIAVGQIALMSSDAYPGRLFRARVREITLGGDPDQRAFRARLAPLSREPLPIGLTLEINIVTREKRDVLLVPESALVDGHAFVVDNARVRRVAIKTGIAGAERVEVTGGLAAGDVVVSDPADDLGDGARVRVTSR